MVLAIAALLFQMSSMIPGAGAPAPAWLPQSNQVRAESAASEPLFATDAAPAPSELNNAEPRNFSASDPAVSSSAGTSLVSAVRRSEPLSLIRVAPSDAKPARIISADALPSRRKWIALALTEHSAAAFDAYTTRRAIAQGAFEADPLMRPFAGSPAIYAAIQAAPLVLDFAARRMQRSQNGFLRRTWWAPQSAATGMFLLSGFHNLRVSSQLH